MKSKKVFYAALGTAALLLAAGFHIAAQSAPTPYKALLVLEKDTTTLDIIDPTSLKIVAKVKVGADPHEVIASTDGKIAYVSNYMGQQGPQHMLSVVDLIAQKALPPIELGALKGPHGLDFGGGKLYFTADTSMVIGRYDPATAKIDWVMGTGQDRTHMVWVSEDAKKIITSNVSSGTISIIEESMQNGFGGPPPGGRGPQGGPQGAPPQGQPGAQGHGPGGPPPGGGMQENWEVTTVPARQGSEGFDVSPDGKEIWTANAGDSTATIIDFAAKKDILTMPVGINGNRLKFTPDGKYVLISGGLGGPGGPSQNGAPQAETNLVIIDASSRKIIKQIDLGGGAAGILMDPDGSRAFVASSGGNKVVVVDLKSLSVTGEISPLGQPDGMAWAIRQ
jgi:YVTN family beta-propeller protein